MTDHVMKRYGAFGRDTVMGAIVHRDRDGEPFAVVTLNPEYVSAAYLDRMSVLVNNDTVVRMEA